MRITASLSVRDEAHNLGDCLKLLKPVVDEIVIVDTGSIDSSPDIARDHGALVIEQPWQNDFAAVRNTGLGRASGDWILYIDADERLQLDRCLDPHPLRGPWVARGNLAQQDRHHHARSRGRDHELPVQARRSRSVRDPEQP